MTTMGFTNAEQVYEVFLSGGMGFLLGMVYDGFRLVRYWMRWGKVIVFLQDVLFFLVAAPVTFLFSLAMTDGQVRGYVLVGLLGGFFAYRYTLGRVFLKTFTRLTRITQRWWVSACRVFMIPFGWGGRQIRRLTRIPCEKCKKVAKKAKKFFKKGLQPISRLVYNHRV